MTHIRITKGLDIPIEGVPQENSQRDPQPLIGSGEVSPSKPTQIALDLSPFETTKFKLLAKIGEEIKIGQPIAEDKSCPGRYFCSPAGGILSAEIRGAKRVLLSLVIDTLFPEKKHSFTPLSLENASREQLVEALLQGGIFSKIRVRPFNRLADPQKVPEAIFVKGLESAPFVPPAELQVAGHAEAFERGLQALAKLTSGLVHLVYRQDSPSPIFTEAKHVQKHTVEGPHPIANASLHIQYIRPICSAEDVIWTLSAHDVLCIGYLLMEGRYYVDRIISIAGPGVLPEKRGYFRGREGLPVSQLISGRIPAEPSIRLISGDPLMGKRIAPEGFLGFYDFTFSAVPEGSDREFLHFFRLGADKYTFSKAYLSGHRHTDKLYYFTTSQHGERRAFVDATLYDQVMPLPISTMLLVKAVMAEDYELAEQLGLLSVDSEDFALPTFVCPSKIEMTEIIKQGLRKYAYDMLAG
jgi:Na+-transporting NADH:ubiquinone oxidoreductase subunit A